MKPERKLVLGSNTLPFLMVQEIPCDLSPKQELPIEIRHVYRVHVDDVHILEP